MDLYIQRLWGLGSAQPWEVKLDPQSSLGHLREDKKLNSPKASNPYSALALGSFPEKQPLSFFPFLGTSKDGQIMQPVSGPVILHHVSSGGCSQSNSNMMILVIDPWNTLGQWIRCWQEDAQKGGGNLPWLS